MGKRLLQTLIALLCISFATFLLTYLAPGDPAAAMYAAAGIAPTEAMLKRTQAAMGLDKPFITQYTMWLTACLHGDFGTSFSKKTLVVQLLSARVWPTLALALLSLGIMMIVSLPLGIYTALRRDKLSDYIVRGVTFVGISMPGFLVGLALIYIFAYRMKLLPVIASGGGFSRMILPSATLAIAMSSKYIRQTRTAFLEELSQDYVIGARARGIRDYVILWRHALPNSALPLVTALGISFGSLLGGAAVVEIVFSYPGLGSLAVNAVAARDYPLIQGFTLWIALIYMGVNLLTDIAYRFIDPRLREGGRVKS